MALADPHARARGHPLPVGRGGRALPPDRGLRAAREGLRRRRVARSSRSARDVRSCSSPATPTPSPRRATCPAGSRTAFVVGLGASDMKGGVAVMLELADWAADAQLAYDVGFLFFPREELGPAANPLPGVFERTAIVDEARLVIVPRADRQHAPARLPRQPQRAGDVRGALGALGPPVARRERDRARARRARSRAAARAARRGGRRARLPRGDLGHRAARRHRVERDSGDRHGDRQLPLRARPLARLGRGADARARWRGRHRGDPLQLAAGARRRRVAALVERFARRATSSSQPKQAWTNVADFAARGLDAVNLGPGATRYAHAADERVEIAELERTSSRRPAAVPRGGSRAEACLHRRLAPVARRADAVLRSRGSTTGRHERAARGHRADRLRHGRPARARRRRSSARRCSRSIDEVSSYPRATGLPELREAIAGWIGRRFGVDVDPATELVPTLGSKEAIFSFAQVAARREARSSRSPSPRIPSTSAARCSPAATS